MSDLYGGNVVKNHLGRLVIKKLAGSGPLAVGTQIVIPHASGWPRNPKNISFLSGINSSGGLSGDVQGKYTPYLSFQTVIKTASFFTANFVNSAILSTDANGDTDTWSVLFDDKYQPAIYDGVKFASMRIQQMAQGGPMILTMAGIAMYGDSMNPGTLFPLTTFTSTSTDAGQVTDVTKISFGSTADLVSMLDMTLIRPQAHVPYDDGTYFMSGVTSGLSSGNVELVQSPKYAASWGSTGTVNIGTAGAGVSIAMLIKNTEDIRDFVIGTRLKRRAFAFYDGATGGIAIAATAL